MIYKRAQDAERLFDAPPVGLLVCLIHGRDRSGVRERGRRLAASLGADLSDPFNSTDLTEAEFEREPSRLDEALSSVSLFGGRRFVRLQLSGERSAADRLAAEAVRTHLDGGFDPTAFLLIEAGALAASSPLRRAVEAGGAEAAAVPVYEDEEADLGRIVRDALGEERIGLAPDALKGFTARLPKERGVARQEIERLVLFLGPGSGRTFSLDELEPFFGPEADASLAEAATHAFGARLEPALSHLKRAFGEGEAGPAAVAAASRHLQRLHRIGVQTRAGTTLAQALKSNGVFWKQEREVSRQVRGWPDAALDRVQALILEADAACKSTGAPAELLSEHLYLAIASAGRRAGL